MTEKTLEITPDVIIGDLLDAYPEAEQVIERYFGQGCFSCPGMRVESLSFGALMHGKDVEQIVRDLEAACGKECG